MIFQSASVPQSLKRNIHIPFPILNLTFQHLSRYIQDIRALVVHHVSRFSNELHGFFELPERLVCELCVLQYRISYAMTVMCNSGVEAVYFRICWQWQSDKFVPFAEADVDVDTKGQESFQPVGH